MTKHYRSSEPTVITATVVTAQEFRLTDTGGNESGSFALDHHGNPTLAMKDKQGKDRARIRLSEEDKTSMFGVF